MKTVTLSRQQLYEQVWKTAIRNLAHRYGLSDVGLAKVCKKHEIPRPTIGYWAQKEAGKAPPQTPLPFSNDPRLERITLCDGQWPTPAAKPPEPEPVYDPDILKMLSQAEALPKVAIPAAMRNLHPLVQVTKDGLENATVDNDNMVSPYRTDDIPFLTIHVSKESVRRSLLFVDTLIKTIEKVGGKVKAEKIHWQTKSTVEFGGMNIATLRLRERYKQKKRDPDPKDRWHRQTMEHIPTGLLVLDSGPSYLSSDFHCQDTDKGQRIEDEINRLVIDWIRQAGRARISKREAAEARKREEEQERIRREREAEVKRRRDELHKEQKSEQAKVDRLLSEASNWQQSQTL